MARVVISNLSTSKVAVPSPISRVLDSGATVTVDGVDENSLADTRITGLIDSGLISIRIVEDPNVDNALEGVGGRNLLAAGKLQSDGTNDFLRGAVSAEKSATGTYTIVLPQEYDADRTFVEVCPLDAAYAWRANFQNSTTIRIFTEDPATAIPTDLAFLFTIRSI